MNAFDILKERGFVKQITFEEDLYKAFENESVPFYVGFDPTADIKLAVDFLNERMG